WPLWGFRRERLRARYGRAGGWADRHRELFPEVLAELGRTGPVTASAIEHDANRRRGPWWGWSDVKEALEHRGLRGDVVTAGRRNFERVYALPEQVLPARLLADVLPADEAHRILARRAVAAHGVGTLAVIADYYRLGVAETKAALRELEDAGEVERV